MERGVVRFAGLVLGLLLGAGLVAPGIAAAAPTAPLAGEGRWFVDADGRTVILHGVNQINKLEEQNYLPKNKGFGADDAEKIAELGFNTVRTGLIYKGFEPEIGAYDEEYLAGVIDTVEVLEEEGLFVLFDFHQDMYNERFNGEGFPDWAVLGDARTLPAEPDLGFPLNYFVMPALQRAYDHLLANDADAAGRPLHSSYAEAWRRVAEQLRGRPQVFGYDIFNEPHPGTEFTACANPAGCPSLDVRLTALSQEIHDGIRRADQETIVFYEPFLTFNGGADTHHGDIGPNAGFSYHVYCIASTPGLPRPPAGNENCEIGEQLVFDNAERQSEETGDVLLNTEYGATESLEDIERVTNLLDENLMSWQHWAWFNEDVCCERPEENIIIDPQKPPTPDNLWQEKLDILVRPYPQVTAGEPTGFSFDREGKRFELTYSTTSPTGTDFSSGPGRRQGRTEVFVPRRHYGERYRVEVSGAEVVEPDADAATLASVEEQLLMLRNCRGAEEVELTITDEPPAETATCAEASQDGGGGGSDDDSGGDDPDRSSDEDRGTDSTGATVGSGSAGGTTSTVTRSTGSSLPFTGLGLAELIVLGVVLVGTGTAAALGLRARRIARGLDR